MGPSGDPRVAVEHLAIGVADEEPPYTPRFVGERIHDPVAVRKSRRPDYAVLLSSRFQPITRVGCTRSTSRLKNSGAKGGS